MKTVDDLTKQLANVVMSNTDWQAAIKEYLINNTDTVIAVLNNANIPSLKSYTVYGTSPAMSAILSFEDEVKEIRNRIYGNFITPVPETEAAIKCECGAHKLGVKNHSSWCPLHGKE